MIVLDTAKPEKRYYSEIGKFYTLVEEYPPPKPLPHSNPSSPILGQEFFGMQIYQKQNETCDYASFPPWWFRVCSQTAHKNKGFTPIAWPSTESCARMRMTCKIVDRSTN